MAHSRDSNPKCLLSPRAKIPTISREEMKCHWEELLGRQKFGVRPLRQEARTSKNKSWGGGGWQGGLRPFREHTGRGSIRIQHSPKAKGCSEITLHKVWSVTWKDPASEQKEIFSLGIVLTDTKVFSFLYICTAWFYLLYILCIHSSSELLSLPNSWILLGHSLLFLIIII